MNWISSLRSARPFAIGVLVLTIILGLLFANSFRPKQVVFSNDGPLGVLKADAVRFDPPLPDPTRDAIARLGVGPVV